MYVSISLHFWDRFFLSKTFIPEKLYHSLVLNIKENK